MDAQPDTDVIPRILPATAVVVPATAVTEDNEEVSPDTGTVGDPVADCDTVAGAESGTEAGTDLADSDSDLIPHERVFHEAMERIATLHQDWLDAVARLGAVPAPSDAEQPVTEAAA